MPKVVIVGAGPAGLLLAHYLLQRGEYSIQIYERRPDPRQIEPKHRRTYPITLQTRGLAAIQPIPGLEAALTEQGTWADESTFHTGKGNPRTMNWETPLLMIDRNQLTQSLLQHLLQDEAEGVAYKTAHGSSVSVRFNCTCVRVNRDDRSITLEPEQGETFEDHFDYLVGADGVSSQVRTSLEDQSALECQVELAPEAYKSLFARKTSPDDGFELAANQVHSWPLPNDTRIIIAPLPGDWMHGTLSFPRDDNPLQDLPTAADVRAYLQQKCPDLARLMPFEEIEALQQRPISEIREVECDCMHIGNRILLIGDAVHAVSPSIGHGCNAALQDAQAFAQLLEQYQDDWSQALPAFTAQRLPEAHALQELAEYSFPRTRLMRWEFLLRLVVGQKLGHWCPHLSKPLPIKLLTDEEMPYSEVLQQTQGWVDRVKQAQA
jgi:kynurenine 3-monooxygenase